MANLIERWKITGTDGTERVENKRQAYAFRLWQEMGCGGSEKTMTAIGNHTSINVKERSVWRWKDQYRWEDRMKAIEANEKTDWGTPAEEVVSEAIKEYALDHDLTATEVAGVKRILELVDDSIEEYGKRLDTGEIRLDSPKDLKTLVEIRDMILNPGGKAGGGKSGGVTVNVITGIPRPANIIEGEMIDVEVEDVEIP